MWACKLTRGIDTVLRLTGEVNLLTASGGEDLTGEKANRDRDKRSDHVTRDSDENPSSEPKDQRDTPARSHTYGVHEHDNA